MKQSAAIFLISFIFAALILSVTVSQNTFAKSAKDSKARRDIDKSIGRAVEGAFSKVKTVNISTYAVPNEVATVYNKSSGGSLPPIITPPPPVIPPTTDTEGYKICMVGDFKDAKLFDAMKTNGCNYRVAVGDMGYDKTLDLLKSINPDRCVPGNHDAKEDGSTEIEKEALAYCGNSWWVKFGSNPSTLMLGFNTQGDSAKQLNAAKSLFNDTQIMSGVKNVIAVSHKGGHVFPSAHHPAEAKIFYADFEKAVPSTVKLLELSGHNHNSAAAPLKGWYITGNGGKSFYSCGNDKDWTFCNNKTISYLQATIGDNGQIAIHFIDTSGKTIF